jgi:hypothetical protein
VLKADGRPFLRPPAEVSIVVSCQDRQGQKEIAARRSDLVAGVGTVFLRRNNAAVVFHSLYAHLIDVK